MKNGGNEARVCYSRDVLLNRWSTNSMSLMFGYPLRLLHRSHKNAEPSTRYFYGNVFWNCSPWPIHFRAPFSGPHSHLKWFISSSRFLNSPFFPGIKLPLESMIFAGLEMVVQILQSVWYNHSPARQKNQRWIDMCFYFVCYSHAFVQDLLLYLPDNLGLFFWNPVSCRCLSQTNKQLHFTIQCNGKVQPPVPNYSNSISLLHLIRYIWYYI